MASKVFLHIGAPKTGTTYLQQLMAANRDALQEQGVLYADGKYPQDRVWASEVLRDHDLSSHPKPAAAGAWDRILEQVRTWDGPAVVSHEFFGVCSAEQAARAHRDLAPAEVHIVFTARDYVRQVAAVWQERLKYGFSTPLTDFSMNPGNGSRVWSWRSQDVVAVLGRWQHDLPPSRIHVVTVPPAGGSSGALWERFASVIGVDPASCRTHLPMVNTSLGLAEAELLRRVDERVAASFDGPRERARWIRDLLANQVLSQGSRERFSLPPEQVDAVARRANLAVEKLADAGYDVVGSLDDLIPADVAPTRLPEDLSPEELLDAAVEALGRLLIEAKTLSDRHTARSQRLRDRVASTVAQERRPSPGRTWDRLRRVARPRFGGSGKPGP